MAEAASTPTLAEALAKVTAKGDLQLEPAQGTDDAPVLVPLRAHSAVLGLHSSVLRGLFEGCDVPSSPIKVCVL